MNSALIIAAIIVLLIIAILIWPKGKRIKIKEIILQPIDSSEHAITYVMSKPTNVPNNSTALLKNFTPYDPNLATISAKLLNNGGVPFTPIIHKNKLISNAVPTGLTITNMVRIKGHGVIELTKNKRF